MLLMNIIIVKNTFYIDPIVVDHKQLFIAHNM